MAYRKKRGTRHSGRRSYSSGRRRSGSYGYSSNRRVRSSGRRRSYGSSGGTLRLIIEQPSQSPIGRFDPVSGQPTALAALRAQQGTGGLPGPVPDPNGRARF